MRIESEYCREVVATAVRTWEPFNEHHAVEQRVPWHEGQGGEGKGLRRADALELVNKWNRMGLDYRFFLHA